MTWSVRLTISSIKCPMSHFFPALCLAPTAATGATSLVTLLILLFARNNYSIDRSRIVWSFVCKFQFPNNSLSFSLNSSFTAEKPSTCVNPSFDGLQNLNFDNYKDYLDNLNRKTDEENSKADDAILPPIPSQWVCPDGKDLMCCTSSINPDGKAIICIRCKNFVISFFTVTVFEGDSSVLRKLLRNFSTDIGSLVSFWPCIPKAYRHCCDTLEVSESSNFLIARVRRRISCSPSNQSSFYISRTVLPVDALRLQDIFGEFNFQNVNWNLKLTSTISFCEYRSLTSRWNTICWISSRQ